MIEDFKNIAEFNFNKTKFVGYDNLVSKSKIVGLFDGNNKQVDLLTGSGFVCFDQTPFYAISGGQASDEGVILFNNQLIKLIDVRKDLVLGYYIHEVNTNNIEIKINDILDLQVDEQWRSNSAINHSSLHIMWQTILKLIGYHVNEVGSKLDKYKYQLQFDVDEKLTPDLVFQAANNFNNQYANNDIKSNIFFISNQEAQEKHYLFEFTKIANDELVRMVEFPGIVIEPCSGTHVASTKEIKQTWFLDYDKNQKRILIEMTSNSDYAQSYFNDKLNNKFLEIEKLIAKAQKQKIETDFSEFLIQGKEIIKQWNYFAVKKINELYNQVAAVINKELKNLEGQLINEIKVQTFEFEEFNNCLLLETKNDLYSNKVMLSKVIEKVNQEKNKVIIFINIQLQGTNIILMKHQSYDFDLKTELLNKILTSTSLKGGGNSSMLQLTSQDSNDIVKLKEILSCI